MQHQFHSRTDRLLAALRTALMASDEAGHDRPAFVMALYLHTLMCHYAASGTQNPVSAGLAAAAVKHAASGAWTELDVDLAWQLRWILGRKGTRIHGPFFSRPTHPLLDTCPR